VPIANLNGAKIKFPYEMGYDEITSVLDSIMTGMDFEQKSKRGPREPKEMSQQDWFDALAVSTVGLPVVGDVAGLAADANMYATDPESHNAFNYGMTALGALPFVPPASVAAKAAKDKITAYHGSPHDFDEFKMSQIGTGEGAQAYGHGLYFADSEDVAKGYRDNLSDAMTEARYTLGGNEYQRGSPEWKAIGTVQNDGLESAQELGRVYANDLASGEKYLDADFVKRYNDAISQLESGAEIGEARGRMYQVNIDASPDELLDWDKPLSEQSETVKSALSGLSDINKSRVMKRIEADGFSDGFSLEPDSDGFYAQADNSMFNEYSHFSNKPDALKWLDERVSKYSDNSEIGANAYRRMTEDMGDQALGQINATNALSEKGIKGIKYKDGFSRGAEGGTSNYVIFDDRLITIAKKYGIAIPAAALLLSEQTGQDFSNAYQLNQEAD
jgi:hypothetical protein